MNPQWPPGEQANIQQIVREFCTDVSEITFIEHGHDNLVACVNREFVFRFPRNEQAAKRLAFEVELLEKLKGKIRSVPIAEVVKTSGAPPYAVMRFVEGEHLDGEIAQMTDEEQEAVGRQLAEFIAEFPGAISANELMSLREKAGVVGLRENWQQYFQRVFAGQLPDERLKTIVGEYYLTWLQYVGQEDASLPIHDDLHPSNILFVGSRVSAVLDFADATTGSIEEEMRGLYRMGDKVLRVAIARYQELTGRSVDYDHVRVWVVTNELARFTRYFGEGKTDYPIFKLAQANLRHWLPNFPL
jgi:aminoglycoside 2''-phosphotransferase